MVYIVHQVVDNLETFKTGMAANDFWAIVWQLLGLVIFWALVYLVLFIPGLAMGVRRFRDAGVHWSVYAGIQVLSWAVQIVFRHNSDVGSYISLGLGVIVLIVACLPSKNPPQEEAN